ncbi:MAG: tripartite tricarboxylate transporter substrate binding protein [Gammaproteobacteria bacterium]|nr:tripartite tricarboxylate transporter substrate binding protein [Gammaproteobacteria bacterium]
MKRSLDGCTRFVRLLTLGALLAPAWAAADYPDKPIRLVVPYAAGGAADILARSYAEKLKLQMGQPVVVDNKPGATGTIGTDTAAKAAGDGYTLVLNSTAIVINPWLVKQPFDVMKDLTPVARTAETPYVVMVGPKVPVRNFDEFIAYAKKNPGKLECSTYGTGSPPHIALELIKKSAGIDVLHVPYKTFSQALPDLLSGQLGCAIDLPTVPLPFVKAGQLRAIANTGREPMSMYPEAEPVGKRYPGATVVGWQAIFAPASTPKPVLDKLRAGWSRALADPEVQQKIRDAGYQPSGGGSIDTFAKEMATDYEKFGKIIQETGIRQE